MYYPLYQHSHRPSILDAGLRALHTARDTLTEAARPIAESLATRDITLRGLRLAFVGEAADAGMLDLARDMGATVEVSPACAGRRTAADTPDVVVAAFPSASGNEVADWQQVARMRIDNPRLVVVLLDRGRGAPWHPAHDLAVTEGASRDDLREALVTARVMRRQPALTDLPAAAPVQPLFRRSAPRAHALFGAARAA